MKKNTNRIFYKNTAMLYMMTLATYIFPLITLPYLTRVLEPDYYGIITYMTATVSYFQIFIDFGFNFSATKKISQNRENKQYVAKVISSTIRAKFILVIISFAAFSLLIPFITILKDNIFLAYLYFLSAAISIFLLDFLYRGIEKMEIITLRYVSAKLVSTGLTFVLVSSKEDLIFVPILNILGSLFAIILTWIHVKKSLKLKIIPASFRQAWKDLKVSAIYFVATFTTTAFGATNTFVMGIINMPPEQIAGWTVSYQLVSAVQSAFGPIVNSLYPHMAAKKDFKLAKRVLIIAEPIIMVGTVVAMLLSGFIINIFAGSGYEGAIPILTLLLPLLIFSFPAQIIGFPVLGVIGKEKQTTRTTIVAAIFHIISIALLMLFNQFTLINLAILRCTTEFLLFAQRAWILRNFMKKRTTAL